MDDKQTEFMIEEIVKTLETVISDFDSRLAVLEADGFEVIRDMDPERTDYRKGALASIGGGGLKQWTGSEWRTVMNGVESVRIEGGNTLVVERSDGTIERTPFGKATRAKPKAVAA